MPDPSDWRRDRRTTTERGYGYRWQKERIPFLKAHPLCRIHLEERSPPQLIPSTVVDHRKPHRGDPILFWDKRNWQAICKECHDSVKQRLEKSGRASVQIGEDGFPV